MSTIRFRPTFQLKSNEPSKQIAIRISDAVANHSSGLLGQFKNQHAMISMVESKRHFWSPWLHLDIRDFEDGHEVFGRFSPHPSIWTAFMFAYLSLAVLTFFAIIIGTSQLLAGQSPFAFYSVPIWVAIAALLWLASQAGQKFARAEMETMKRIVEDAVIQG